MESNSGQTWSTVASGRKVQTQSVDREGTFHDLQDMFKGQVDADVVYMVLQESDWKGQLIQCLQSKLHHDHACFCRCVTFNKWILANNKTGFLSVFSVMCNSKTDSHTQTSFRPSTWKTKN